MRVANRFADLVPKVVGKVYSAKQMFPLADWSRFCRRQGEALAMTLKRNIGPLGLTFVAVSGVIGSGWIFGPLIAAQIAGPAALVSWAIGGIGMLVLALSYAEISSIIPVAGGIARLPAFSHGKTTTMVMGWTAWLGYNTQAPIETIAALDYLAAYYPAIRDGTDTQFSLSPLGMSVAIALLAFFTWINAIGVRFFARTNTAITWIKIIIPVLLAACLIDLEFNPGNFTEYGGFMPMGWSGVFAAVASGGIVFSFIGFRHAIDMAGETSNPQRTIPMAIIFSILLCIAIYSVLQLAFIGALSHEQLAEGWSHIKLGNKLGPLASLVVALGITWITLTLYAGVFIGPVGAALVSTGSGGRLVLAMAENDLFPDFFRQLSSRSIPLRGMLLNLVIGALTVVAFSFEQVVTLNSATIILSFSIGPVALVCFRKQFPHLKRRFRLPVAEIVGVVGFALATLIIYWSGWQIVLLMFAVLGSGVVVFLLHIALRRLPLAALNLGNAVWLLPYLLGIAGLSYLGNYGGGRGIVSQPWDLLLALVLSGVSFVMAVACRLSTDEAQTNLDRARVATADRPREGILDEKVP
ncbi:MAG: APC family permease [Halioglobus sp.]|nr:APC family permease [Halioglobus sp.]